VGVQDGAASSPVVAGLGGEVGSLKALRRWSWPESVGPQGCPCRAGRTEAVTRPSTGTGTEVGPPSGPGRRAASRRRPVSGQGQPGRFLADHRRQKVSARYLCSSTELQAFPAFTRGFTALRRFASVHSRLPGMASGSRQQVPCEQGVLIGSRYWKGVERCGPMSVRR
jgi:hypothetical protein